MSEPIGWNVYDTTGVPLSERGTFREFIPNEEALAPVAEQFADEVEEFAASRPQCGGELFRLPGWLATAWPDSFIRLHGAAHGPAPVLCAREPHDDPWHWDGKGTWFR